MLTLPIRKKWFDMILSGEKLEEYRNLTPHYDKRFSNLFRSLETDKQYIQFRNGYSAESPSFVALCSWSIKKGKPEWGAEPNREYHTLTIHSIQEKKNCEL